MLVFYFTPVSSAIEMIYLLKVHHLDNPPGHSVVKKKLPFKAEW